MISANELRVGNIVKKDEVEYVADFITIQMAHNYSPISLTPEILEKCGFVQVRNGIGLRVFGGYVFVSMLFNLFPLVLDIDNSRMPLNNIKYLHQLQNLYFALTGVELTFKKENADIMTT